MHKKNAILYAIFAIDIVFLFWNFILVFIFSLFLVMVLMSSGGYGSPEGKWQAYTTGTGNWRIGGIAARSEDYEATRVAENIENKKIGAGEILYVILGIIIIVALVGMWLGYGSLLGFI